MSARASDRAWLPATLLLLACALVAWSGWLSRVDDDCRNPGALSADGGIPRTSNVANSTPRSDEGVFQMTDGRVRQKSRKRAPLGFRVIRSDRAGSLLFDVPHWFMPWNLHTGNRSVRKDAELEGAMLPLTYRYDDSDPGYHALTAWFFAMSGRAIASPLEGAWSHLRSSIGRGLPPVTIVLVYGSAPISEGAKLDARAEQWLRAAWLHYQRACPL